MEFPVEFEVDAILFDSDGVLVDSHEQVEQAWRQLADEYGLDAEGLLPELIGVRAEDTLGRYLDPQRCREAASRLEDLEVASAGVTRPLAGAAALLAQLDGPFDGCWTVVTSATRRLGEARWAGAGLPVPPNPVTADDVSAGKPDPEPFLAGARTLEVPARRCLVFEDSPSGGRAGLAAGATVVAVGAIDWPVRPAARIPDLTVVTVGPGHQGRIRVSLAGT